MLESIVGGGGVLVPPPGYMKGVRELCDKYDILLHLDEVMVGFGRTGKLFGFQHFDGVIPDIVTCAKGISSAALPISMMACRKHIMDSFEDKPLGWVSTYEAHPVTMACVSKEKLYSSRAFSYSYYFFLITKLEFTHLLLVLHHVKKHSHSKI